MSERFDKGMQVRRKVLGDTHVDRAEAAKTAFDEPFQTLITEGAWGTVWASDGISLRERSMLTLASDQRSHPSETPASTARVGTPAGRTDSW